MALNDIRKILISHLKLGAYQHDRREALAEKNLLAVGDVNRDFVIELLRACRPEQYDLSPHHIASRVGVHTFRPVVDGTEWYVKAYLVEQSAVFISVHRAGQGSEETADE